MAPGLDSFVKKQKEWPFQSQVGNYRFDRRLSITQQVFFSFSDSKTSYSLRQLLQQHFCFALR